MATKKKGAPLSFCLDLGEEYIKNIRKRTDGTKHKMSQTLTPDEPIVLYRRYLQPLYSLIPYSSFLWKNSSLSSQSSSMSVVFTSRYFFAKPDSASSARSTIAILIV